MKARFINRLVSAPWNISPVAGRTIISNMLATLLRNERPSADIFGDPLPVMSIVGNVALIPISGVLMLNVPDWVKQFGFNVTDPNDIEDEFTRARNDPNVEMIVELIDSPGGESVAGEKLFDLAETAMRTKPVFAFSADGAQMCSSAYQAAAPAVAILAGKFAEVGCVGSYMAFLDDSQFWAQMGIKWEVFRSGDLKGIGEDGTLTPDQRAYLDGITQDCGNRFRASVAKYRTEIDPADMQGQWFRGSDAAANGFTAGVAKDQDAALAKFRKLV